MEAGGTPRGSAAVGRRARMERLERLLDEWIGRFEEALGEARPDPSKTTELANVFTICKRVVEIEQLERRLADGEDAAHAHARGSLVDSVLFGDGVPDED